MSSKGGNRGLSLRVRKPEPVIRGDVFDLMVFCTVTGDDADGQTVVCIVNGVEIESKQVENGVVVFDLKGFELKAYVLTVKIEGTNISRDVSIPAPKVPIKTTPEVTSITATKSGANGNYLITITVMTNKGPAKQCRVQVTDRSPKGADVSDFATDDHGTHVHRVQVNEPERFLTYKVLGGEGYVVLDEKTTKPIRLFGPRSE